MIKLRRLNGKQFVLNSEHIETVEATPDSVITLMNGKKFVVTEGVDDIIDKVLQYKGKIAQTGICRKNGEDSEDRYT